MAKLALKCRMPSQLSDWLAYWLQWVSTLCQLYVNADYEHDWLTELA
ncbi:hypothetical protein RR48_12087 [Papilio machaon]|uniref:Uncharacterized protein n=1 Tax=Papilio machaon TaxID=76193 RepID=A0A194RLE3_PAPMA|nr:hypothetical protein RR48_12087 [Papilio machaon]